MTNKEKFEKLLAWGEEGEKIIGELLLQEGWFVQPLYQYEKKKTPYIFYYNGDVIKIIAPDISIIKEGQLLFVECKRKNEWVKDWRGIGSLETGFNNSQLLSYLKTYDLTKIPIEVYFIQEEMEPIGIYKLRIDSMTRDRLLFEPSFRRIDYMTANGKEVCMSFFDIKDLIKVK